MECEYGCDKGWAWCFALFPCEDRQEHEAVRMDWFRVQQAWEELATV